MKTPTIIQNQIVFSESETVTGHRPETVEVDLPHDLFSACIGIPNDIASKYRMIGKDVVGTNIIEVLSWYFSWSG
jgi:hypothetical protein